VTIRHQCVGGFVSKVAEANVAGISVWIICVHVGGCSQGRSQIHRRVSISGCRIRVGQKHQLLTLNRLAIQRVSCRVRAVSAVGHRSVEDVNTETPRTKYVERRAAQIADIAAELQVPVMMHIQTFPHFEGELPYNTGYTQFDKMLRAYPRTNFIGHGDLFWAHISADVPTDRGYPAGPIKKGGLTDRWLSDFPNLYADMSANSGNNALSRDPEFSPGFITRHKSKLIFGSDCSCTDGHGAGISQGNNPEASRLAGKCVARETLTVLKRFASPAIFRAITFDNGVKLFKIPT